MHPLIPADKHEAVRRALIETFGREGADRVEPVAGGLSRAPVLRLNVSGESWLLRIERPNDGLNDPARFYVCQRAASDAGIAPELVYAHAADGVAISRFIQARPLSEHRAGRNGVFAELGRLTAAVRALPLFPPLVHFLEGVDGLVDQLVGSGAIDERAIAPRLERWAALRDAYAWDEAGLVSSHNDLNPANVIYDGERLWIVDWEAAFRNDPFVDLGVIANFFGADADEQALLLQATFGEAPGAERLERLTAMRGICRVYHGVLLMNSALAQGCPPTAEVRGMATAPLDEVRQALATRRLDLSRPEQRLVLGKAMLNAA